MKRSSKLYHLAALTTAAGILIATSSEAAGRRCAPRDTVVTRLAEGYGERRQSIGLGANNAVIEIFASDETGSWTIVVTDTAGVTCLVASGLAFEALAESLPAKGSNA
jgi:hypothetical protein